MRRYIPAMLWGLLPLALLAVRLPSSRLASAFATPAVVAQLDAADRHFDQKSYAAALDGYRAALASGVNLGERRTQAEYRYAVSLGKAERWDGALKEAEAFAKRYPGTLWEARGQYWLGRLLVAVPHTGYKVGDR